MSNDDYDDKDLDFTRKPPPVPPPPAPAAAKPAAQRPTPPAVAAAAPAATPARGAPSGAPRSVAAATAQPAAPAGAQQRRLIASRAEFSAALDEVIGRTERSLRIFDPTLAGFGFNTAARDEQLRTFLLKRRSNRVMIAVHDTSAITQGAPRLMRLLRQFSHAIMIHQTNDAIRNLDDVLVISDDLHCVRRPHHAHPKGVVYLDDPVETREWLNRFNAIWEQSTPAVSATTIGL